MRFMMLMIPNISEDEYASGPSADDVAAMTKFNEALTQAGGLLALDGLHPSSKGARVSLSGGKKTVTDGPFTEAKELIGGYWVIHGKAKEEAGGGGHPAPPHEGNVVEGRQGVGMSH